MRAIILLTAFCLILSASIVAAETATPPDRTIVIVHIYNEFAVVQYSPIHPNSECPADPGLGERFAVVDWGFDPNAKVMLSVIVAAKAMGKAIGLGMSGCFPGWNNVPRIYRVDFN